MPDPIRNAITGHYYQGVTSPNISWNTALAFAAAASYRGLKGYLATVTSAGENATALSATVSVATGIPVYFLGGSDERVEGRWAWQTGPEAGQAFGYSKWSAGEPNNGMGVPQNYLGLIHESANPSYDGAWDDIYSINSVSGYVIEYGGLPASYRIVADTKALYEGQRVTFTVHTANVEWGTTIPYTITGLSSGDLVSGELNGVVSVSQSGADGLAEITLELAEDKLTEGTETITFTVGDSSAEVLVYDTSRTPGYEISTGSTTINEGEAAVFLLKTINIPDGTVLNYTVTGVQAADVIGGLVGSTVVVSGGQAVIAIPTVVDLITENTTVVVGKGGDGKDITKLLYGIEKMTITVATVSTSIQIKDWNSRPQYTITPFANSVREGTDAKFMLKTAGLMPGAAVRYEISGTSTRDDYGNPWGTTWGVAKVTGLLHNGQAVISIPLLADRRDDESMETLKITVGEGTAQIKSATVNIIDSSRSPTCVIKAGASSYHEGKSALFNITTTNVDPGTWIEYQISGANRAADIDIPLQGRMQLDRLAKATLVVPLVSDRVTEGNELLTVEVQIVGVQASASTFIVDAP